MRNAYNIFQESSTGKLFQYYNDNNGLLIALQNDSLEPLLKKAKEIEKKYEWLQAAEVYGKAADLVFAENDILKAAALNERTGFCYYRASLQAQSNSEFRKILKQSILAYEKESKLLEGIKTQECEVKRIHADALTNYVRSWYETDPKIIKSLLSRWWTLEKQVLKAYERSGDLIAVGRTCNDLLEYSIYDRYWLASNYSEHKEMFEESLLLAEKAIKIFSNLDDKYELSRAYVYSCWYYEFIGQYEQDENVLIEIGKKCQAMVNMALELSQEIGDAWLISRSFQVAWGVANNLKIEIPAAIEFGKKMVKYGNVARDNYLLGFGNCLASTVIMLRTWILEDPDQQKELSKKAIKMAQKATHHFQIINNAGGFSVSYNYVWSLARLALIETDSKKRQELFEKALKVGQQGLKRLKGWKRLTGSLYNNLSRILLIISTMGVIEERKELLHKAQTYATKYLKYAKEMQPTSSVANQNRINSLIHLRLAQIETNATKKLSLLTKALKACETVIESLKKKEKFLTQSGWAFGWRFGFNYDIQGEILEQTYSISEEKEVLFRAIEAYKQSLIYYEKADLPTHLAESYWKIALNYNVLGQHLKASHSYTLASEAYLATSRKIPQLREFSNDYSLYMNAWSNIEKARHFHSIEDYEKSQQHYEKAAKLHESTSSWSYLTPNYFAWSHMEKAEGLSRKENTQQAKQTFQKAYNQFCNAEESFKQKLEETTADDEKQMIQRLVEASDLRQKYCQARILMEEAKLLDREGKYLQSSKKYGEAAQTISAIIDKIDVEAERKELKYVSILCQAWGRMANSEETASSESYLEAAELFEQAKEQCYTKKASLWALGNSNFCRGLAAGVDYQARLDVKEHNKAKSYIKNASTNYLKAGYKNASEYAKATLRLFDAYLFMNQAESESDTEKRVKQYQLAENLLELSAGSFLKAKQPEKTAQVQQILENVREEKEIAISFNEVLQAPIVASTTQSFAAPTPTSEVSVGLEKFEHANVQANLVTQVKEVKVGESFSLLVEFVNAGREPALLMRVDDFVPHDFVVVKKPEIYRIEETCLNMKGKQLSPLKLVEVKLTLQPSKKGKYQLNPKVHYLDELGQNKILQLKSLEIKVEEVILENRISTGTQELNSLLLGGIPSEYAVALTGPPSDERKYLIKNFLNAGIKKDDIVFYVSTEADGLEHLLEKPNFYLFLCNPKPKTQIPDLPNVYKLRSKTDLTNLSISLAKAYRNIEPSNKKRICVEIVSDVLLDYEAKATRKWISELITDLGSKGFTMLAVIDPLMHTSEELHAILGLFDGEISLTIIKDPMKCKTSIRVEKLRNQDYIKNPICLI